MNNIKAEILRYGPVTKVAEFTVRGRKYGINANAMKTEQDEQWLLRTMSSILSEVDERAAMQVQHDMQSKFRELLGLTTGVTFGAPVNITTKALDL